MIDRVREIFTAAHENVPPIRRESWTGAELKAWRHKLGLTQPQLANLTGIPRATISGWETGRLRITRPLLLQLALQTLKAELDRKP
jgi:transcriptional regulator with XRE-family HTH domain